MYKSLKFSKTASSQLQYKINTSIIFNYMRQHGPISRAKLARDLNMSAPAVSRVIERLIDEGYVVEAGKAKSKTGKRPILVEINGQKGFVMGIDLGRERIRCMLADTSGKAVKKQWGSPVSDSRNIMDKLYKDIGGFLEDKNYSDLIKTICIGIPAVVDAENGRILSAPLYGSWKDLDIRGRIGEEFGIPVYIENNVNLAALAEKNYGEGQKYSDLFFIEVGNGIGGGIIIDNHLIRGAEGSAGEIGFSIVNEENLGFKVKNKGYLEKHASVTSLQKKALHAVEEGKRTRIKDLIEGDSGRLTPAVVCKAALEGDEVAAGIIGEMVRLLAVAITNSIFLINPQIIVVGGDICNLPEANKLFIEPVSALIKQTLPFKVPPIKLSSMGEDAGVIGSTFMAMEALLVGEFPYKIAQEVSA
ncbi:MAG: ROK family transcriptional regulator [Actinomycetota bacterium]